jgi:hypothetical protein
MTSLLLKFLVRNFWETFQNKKFIGKIKINFINNYKKTKDKNKPKNQMIDI